MPNDVFCRFQHCLTRLKFALKGKHINTQTTHAAQLYRLANPRPDTAHSCSFRYAGAALLKFRTSADANADTRWAKQFITIILIQMFYNLFSNAQAAA